MILREGKLDVFIAKTTRMDVTFVWKFHFDIIPNRCHTHLFRLPDMTSSLKLGINHLGRGAFQPFGKQDNDQPGKWFFVGGGTLQNFQKFLGSFDFFNPNLLTFL